MYKMKTMDFIKIHLIATIRSYARDIKFKNTLKKKWDNFIWFNEPIICDGRKVDRINELFAFYENEIVNVEWRDLKGRVLSQIIKNLKNGDFK